MDFYTRAQLEEWYGEPAYEQTSEQKLDVPLEVGSKQVIIRNVLSRQKCEPPVQGRAHLLMWRCAPEPGLAVAVGDPFADKWLLVLACRNDTLRAKSGHTYSTVMFIGDSPS